MTILKDFRIGGSRLLTHIAFWAVIIFANTFIYGTRENQYLRQFIIEMASLPHFMLAAYINLYILLPRYLVKKKYTQYFTLVLILLFITSNIQHFIFEEFINPKISRPEQVEFHLTYLPVILWHMFWILTPILFITSSIKLYKQWYFRGQQNQELAREKLVAELNYLKAQVNPHFLFNTLNNLYSLTLQKSESAPQIVLKLSGLMRYMLHDSQEAKIELSKELVYIQSYIELEKIRYGERLEISFNVHGDIKNKYIAPLILIPFIENAFKHGASNITEDSWVTIDIKVKDELIAVKVENNKNREMIAKDEGNYRGGIGLKNVKRRLALVYGEKHELHIVDDSAHYAVDLKINLEENHLYDQDQMHNNR